jgi:hypothetical protein
MKSNSLVFLTVCLLISTNAIIAQTTISGVSMPATMKAGNSSLVLNGAGIRVKFFMDIYVGGLYVGAKSKDGDAISKANEAGAVKLHIVSGMATSERMADAVKEGFEKSTGGKTGPLQARIDRFVKLFKAEPIVKGNEFDNIYVPGIGTQIFKNGKLLDTIEGLDFKTALWGIWLGSDPVQENLKVAMLGGK